MQYMTTWHAYIVRCSDGSLYTGISTDVTARIAKHDTGKGAAYTRSRGPVMLVWSRKMATESEARKQEASIKKLTKQEKEAFVRRRRVARGRKTV